jgi:hypothetical protein
MRTTWGLHTDDECVMNICQDRQESAMHKALFTAEPCKGISRFLFGGVDERDGQWVSCGACTVYHDLA